MDGGKPILHCHDSCTSLMVVHNLDLLRSAVTLDEADSPLVVDADTVPSLPITAEGFQRFAGIADKVFQPLGGVQNAELAPRHGSDVPKSATPFAEQIPPSGLSVPL